MMGLTWCNLIQGSKYLLTVDESQLKIYFSSPERVFMLQKKKKRSESTNTFEFLAFNIVNIYYINIIKRSGDW